MYKMKKFLLLPIACYIIWSLLAFLIYKDVYIGGDFLVYYDASNRFIFDIGNLYTEKYYYLPNFTMVLSFLSLVPYEFATAIFYIMILLAGIGTIIVLDSILTLNNITNIKIRIVFLLIISNGYILLRAFALLNAKPISLFLFLLVIQRELKYNNNELNKNLTFYFIQSSFLIFAISIIPSLVFIIFIYLFYNIDYRKIFEKEQLKKYGIFIGCFIIQNIVFIIFPNLIFGFLNGFNNVFIYTSEYTSISYEQILNLGVYTPVPLDALTVFWITFLNIKIDLSILTVVILCATTILLIYKKSISIEEKFGIFALVSLLFNVILIRAAYLLFISMLPLLFIRYFKDKNEKFVLKDFIKEDKLIFIGLISIVILFFIPQMYFLVTKIPIITNIPIEFILFIRPILYIVILLVYYFSRKKIINKKIY